MDRIAVAFIFLTLVAVLGSGKFMTNSLTCFFAFFCLKRFNCNRETLQTDETQWPSEVHVNKCKIETYSRYMYTSLAKR